ATYATARAAFLDDFMDLTGEAVPLETFDALPASDPVGDMPGNPARFAPEGADGSPLPLPVIQVSGSAVSGNQWMANFGNGRPAGSSWVIRPDEPGDAIYAFAQSNAQGDWVRIIGYDASDDVVVSLDASNQGTAFAGFITDIPLAKVVVTPLGNFDLLNGMDDVFVSVTPNCILFGDTNGDEVVNFEDLNIVLEFWNATTTPGTNGDVTGDGVVNFEDLNEVLEDWGDACL
ncbi:MAG: hypothetical protein KDA21_14290, partial [Phycisphaerales bacterium]|nr:hypothetical protein [Phycisphaerales bacterium]